jgi:lysozyme family protein
MKWKARRFEMADIMISIGKTVVNEGGFVDDPDDKGGATKYGIEQRDWPEVNIADITPEQAAEWYRTTTKPEVYNNPLFTEIDDQDVCDKIFDMGVLFGVGTAARLAQAVLGIAQDEVFGAATLSAINTRGGISFLPAYKARLVVHARWIPTQDVTQTKFVNGWVNRINE